MAVDVLILRSMYPPSQPEIQPLQRLATAVVHQAVDDLSAPQPARRADAVRFFQSDSFETWGGLTSINVTAARAKLLGR